MKAQQLIDAVVNGKDVVDVLSEVSSSRYGLSFPGWTVESTFASVMTMYKQINADREAIVDLLDPKDLKAGKEVKLQFHIDDHGGYEAQSVFKKTFTVNKDNVESVVRGLDKYIDEWSEG